MYVRIVTFALAGLPADVYRQHATAVADGFTAWPGLLGKVWLADDDGRPGDDRTLATLLRCTQDKVLDAVSPLVVDDADPERLAFPMRQGLSWVRTRADLGGRRFVATALRRLA